MTVRDARDILGARVLVGEEYLDREVKSACGSDMMRLFPKIIRSSLQDCAIRRS